MPNQNHREGRDVAVPTPMKPVPSRGSSFVILPNSRNICSVSNNISSGEHVPGLFSAVTSNRSPISPPSFSRSAVIPNYERDSTYNNPLYNHTHTNTHPDNKEISFEENSPRPILQSFNSGFTKPSTLSKTSRPSDSLYFKHNSLSDENANVIEKEEENIRGSVQSKSPTCEQNKTFSMGCNSSYNQEQDDAHPSLGTFFCMQGNQLSSQTRPATGGIRVSPFEPIVCDRKLPRQGRISPLPISEYEAWCAQRRARETTASYQSDISKHRLTDEFTIDSTQGRNIYAEEEEEIKSTAQFRPVSITPIDHDNLKYICPIQDHNESLS